MTGEDSRHSEARRLGALEEKAGSAHARIDGLDEDVKDIGKKIERGLDKMYDLFAQNYVTKSEFWAVRAIVYGAVGIIGVAVLGAVVASVVVGSSP